MNAKLVAAVLVGVSIGFGMMFLAKPQEAQANKTKAIDGKPVVWEFKVASFGEKNSEEELAQLSAAGWEYVGLIRTDQGNRWATVAFKRPKR